MFFNLFKKKQNDVHEIDKTNLPMHIGIIMDGNGRWAKKRRMPRNVGHRAGAEVLKKITTYADEIGIKVFLGIETGYQGADFATFLQLYKCKCHKK